MRMSIFIKEFLYRTVLKRPGEREDVEDDGSANTPIRHRAVDWLFLGLGVFTHFYGAALTFLFFIRAGENWHILVGILQALQEPYLGALGVYVIVKEIEKHRHNSPSKHYGEFFVGGWLLLLIVSTALVVFSPGFEFDLIYKIIVANALATLIIYIGGVIHRP